MFPIHPHPQHLASAFFTRVGRPPGLLELLRESAGPMAGTPADQAGPPPAPVPEHASPAVDEELTMDPRFQETDPAVEALHHLLLQLIWGQLQQHPPFSPLWGGDDGGRNLSKLNEAPDGGPLGPLSGPSPTPSLSGAHAASRPGAF